MKNQHNGKLGSLQWALFEQGEQTLFEPTIINILNYNKEFQKTGNNQLNYLSNQYINLI